MAIDESALRALEDEFMQGVEPAGSVDLEAYRSTIVRFHRRGYSRALTYEFLKSRLLIQCSRASFYRWVAAHVDFPSVASSSGDSWQAPVLNSRQGATQLSAKGTNLRKAIPSHVVSKPHHDQNTSSRETCRSTFEIDSARSGRSSHVAALDAVLQDLQANDMTSVASRALEKLESRAGNENDE